MAADADKYGILYSERAVETLKKMDKSISEKIRKKIDALAVRAPTRALKKHPDVLVLEFGQHRVLYLMDAGKKTKTIFFVGDHKEYEKKYGKMF